MPASRRVLSLLLGLLALSVTAGTGTSLATCPRSSAVVDTTDTSSPEPYATDRSLAYHVLAAPAYVLHGLTRPIGWGGKYLEQKYPELFEPTPRPRGILPRLDLGGPTGFLAGGVLFDRHLFGGSHSARIEGLYGGPETFRSAALYEIPALFGPRTSVRTTAHFFSDPKNEYYLGGNDSDADTDETFFSRRQVDVTLGVRAASQKIFRGGLDLQYKHVTAERGDGLQGDRIAAADPSGLGAVDLLTPRLLLTLDLTQGGRRTHWGPELFVQLDYSHDLNSNRFRYGRYVAELRQYLPVGIFPASRRLVFRVRLEQIQPLLGGSAVPFYQFPSLGGKRALRGFRGGRFQDDGSLLVGGEYRYPLWSNLDAVFFVEAGQVFPRLSAVAANRFHWSYGGGLHLLNKNDLSFRVEVAGSSEGLRTILTVKPTFQAVGR